MLRMNRSGLQSTHETAVRGQSALGSARMPRPAAAPISSNTSSWGFGDIAVHSAHPGDWADARYSW